MTALAIQRNEQTFKIQNLEELIQLDKTVYNSICTSVHTQKTGNLMRDK